MTSNPILELAREFVHYTSKNIFLTGKAGTGKTTFLHTLKDTLPKRMAIVAPTGVAAINAGGVTIHSLFQLPFSPYIPDGFQGQNRFKFNKDKINVLKGLDLLVIDEISMVRADTLDAMDDVLRHYRNRESPFGGVQLLMIGDLHQLPPIVSHSDWQILREHYKNPYFFESKALAPTKPICIELTQIYRQSDPVFVNLLNQVRDNELDEVSIQTLNERFIANFKPEDDEGYITLTTHKAFAHQLNATKLDQLEGEKISFEAEYKGNFPAHNYPTEESLDLKVGAQVMFIKNDPSREKQYYNGKIGKVVRIASDTIYVKCKDQYSEIVVEKAEWQNIKYVMNVETKEMEEQILGSFIQLPLKLAWAITIHKSQGLTFEKAIIDASESFSPGQVYVALSRCKSLNGLVLSKPFTQSSVKTDPLVANFSSKVRAHPPNELQLQVEKQVFQSGLLQDLFDFTPLKKPSDQLIKVIQENLMVLNKHVVEEFQTINDLLWTQLYLVADKFKNQLLGLLEEANGVMEYPQLKTRISQASKYFVTQIQEIILPRLKLFQIETDNTALKQNISNMLEALRHALYIKEKCLVASQHGFAAHTYLQTKSNADIDYFTADRPIVISGQAPRGQANTGLYLRIKSWRNEKAAAFQVDDYQILSLKCISELARSQPRNLKELGKIPGIGKTKLRKFGNELLNLISKNSGEDPQSILKTTKKAFTEIKLSKKKPHPRQITYEAFMDGQSPTEIARARKLSMTAVESHLLYYISTGHLNAFSLFPPEKINPILDYCRSHHTLSATEVRRALGDEFSYAQIRAALQHLQTNG
ncbi:helix-turn-helix domain-containing protein [Dyadobacter tibetensis]|uniref:helix-turn-helix domain-containing protein n=1 Tax=Dyadobacter tibetensis TaxID=1211851 RepID=UPI00046F6D9E|nr:helix-turn-helix domain-containing protein [Dyadobacter tibetensis]